MPTFQGNIHNFMNQVVHSQRPYTEVGSDRTPPGSANWMDHFRRQARPGNGEGPSASRGRLDNWIDQLRQTGPGKGRIAASPDTEGDSSNWMAQLQGNRHGQSLSGPASPRAGQGIVRGGNNINIVMASGGTPTNKDGGGKSTDTLHTEVQAWFDEDPGRMRLYNNIVEQYCLDIIDLPTMQEQLRDLLFGDRPDLYPACTRLVPLYVQQRADIQLRLRRGENIWK